MTDEARRVWLDTLCADLAHKTQAEIADGCRRWRNDPDNRWFPTPGQLLAACKNPWDAKPRRYSELEPLPAARPQHEIDATLQRLRVKYPAAFQERSEPTCVDRKPLEMTPELREREADLKYERQAAIERLLRAAE
jgi:hypothetical protein